MRMSKFGIYKCDKCGRVFTKKIRDGENINHRCNNGIGFSTKVTLLGID